jgi:hypothetical protein
VRRRSLVAGLVAGAAGVLLLRRRRHARPEHVDLYFADGSMVSLERGPEADRLLAVAREGLAAARG